MICNELWGRDLQIRRKRENGEITRKIFKVGFKDRQKNTWVFSNGGTAKRKIKSESEVRAWGFEKSWRREEEAN